MAKEQFGDTDCWELDALEPRVIADLISDNVQAHIDRDLWDVSVANEQKQKKNLEIVADYWATAEDAARAEARENGEIDDEEDNDE